MEILNSYYTELDDLLASINIDKDKLRSQEFSLQDKEFLRSILEAKVIYFHKLFYDILIKIMNDIYSSHIFEYASTQNFTIIKIETEHLLQRFYNIYKYNILPQYFDKVLSQELNEEDYDIVRNNKIDNISYLYLDKDLNTIINYNVMLNYVSLLVFNH